MRKNELDISYKVKFRIPSINRPYVIVTILGSAVFAAVGVEMSAGSGASVRVVAELVNVESMQAFGEARYLARDGHGTIGRLLRQVDHAFHYFAS